MGPLVVLLLVGFITGGGSFPARKNCGVREADNKMEYLRSSLPSLRKEVKGFSPKLIDPSGLITSLTSSILASLTHLSECVDIGEEIAEEITDIFGVLINCFCELLGPVLINPTEASIEFILEIASNYLDFLCNLLQQEIAK